MTRDDTHPGYVIGDHWLEAAYARVCAGENIREVMVDYGWVPVAAVAAEREASDLHRAASNVVRVWRQYGTAESLRGWMEILEAALDNCADAIRARGET